MTDQKVRDLSDITSVASDDYLIVLTDTINNTGNKIKKEDFLTDSVSSDAGNLIEVGSDKKLFSELPESVTLEGNSFNGADELVKLDATGKLPTIDGSALTGVIAEILYTNYVPYSVNSGLTSINKISDTEVSFTGTPTVTFPNGKTYTGLTLNNVTGISADGSYCFIIEEADISNNTVTPKAVLATKINETTANGTGGSDGDYNLNVQVKPLFPEKKISGTWTETQFVKIGIGTKTGGTLNYLYVLAFNGLYISPWTSVGLNTNYNYSHLLGTTLYSVSNKLAQNSDGTGWSVDGIHWTHRGSTDRSVGVPVVLQNAWSITTRGQNDYIAWFIPSGGTLTPYTSGYQRLIIRRAF